MTRRRRAASVLSLLFVVSALAAACTGDDRPPAPLRLPGWESLGGAGLPATGYGFEPKAIAGGDHGFVLAGEDGPHTTGFYTSVDGRTWTRTQPPQVDGHGSVATDGHNVFLLGTSLRSDRLLVLKYLGNGGWSEPVALTPAASVHWMLGIATNWTIAAGPEGVHVAANANEGAIQLWSSPDGKAFTETSVRLKESTLGDQRLGAIQTPIGTAFLSSSLGAVVRVTAGGRFPAAIADKLPDEATIEHVALNGSRLVIQGTFHKRLKEGDPGFVPGDDPLGENDFYLPMIWCGDQGSGNLTQATVDPGQLPDLGVDRTYYPAAVVPYRSGFLMTGQVLSGISGEAGIGGVWLSETGCDWKKDQVRANAFHEVDNLVGVAARGDVTVLVGGHRVDKTELTRLWLGR